MEYSVLTVPLLELRIAMADLLEKWVLGGIAFPPQTGFKNRTSNRDGKGDTEDSGLRQDQ
jgi:hypothetical protein